MPDVSVLNVLSTIYWSFTILKVLQCAVILVSRLEKNKKGSRRIEYIPAVQFVLKLLEVVLFQGEMELSKIPRKEFRDVTDPWIQLYNKNVVQKRSTKETGKVFTSLKDAQKNFMREFCDDASPLLLVSQEFGRPIMHQSLGMTALLCVLAYSLVFLPLLMAREYFFFKSSNFAQRVLCKIAANSTINDVYVVCCKEGLDFDAAIYKFAFVSNMFQGKQPHPLVGRNACPLYKREVLFPKDTMDFDYEALEVPYGQLHVREKHKSRLQNWWQEVKTPQLIIVLAGVYIFWSFGVSETVSVVGPSALTFYATRTVLNHLIYV